MRISKGQMRVLLHIGTDKTGSTAIQQHLALNFDWLRSRSVYVPNFGPGNRKNHVFLLQDVDTDKLEKLAVELKLAADQGCNLVVLSWEGMCAYNAKQIRRLMIPLAAYQVTVLVYLREQADYLQSMKVQQLKDNVNCYRMHVYEHPRTLREKISNKLLSLGLSRNYYLRYHMFTFEHPRTLREKFSSTILSLGLSRYFYRMLRLWKKTIPHANFSVRIFARQHLKNGDVVQDFMEQLGLSLDSEFKTIAAHQNLSIDIETGMLVEFWQANAVSSKDIDRLLDIAQSIISIEGRASKYFLSKERVEKIRRECRPYNRKLAWLFMGVDADPFADAIECWHDKNFLSIESRVEALAQKIAKVDETPTLTSIAQGAEIASTVECSNGWNRPENWGIWSHGPVSRVRFRVLHRWVRLGYSVVKIVILGQYYGENFSTGVIINNIDFGEIKLDKVSNTLTIPISALAPNETIEITLNHSQPVNPQGFEDKNDSRLIAFGLHKIRCIRVL